MFWGQGRKINGVSCRDKKKKKQSINPQQTNAYLESGPFKTSGTFYRPGKLNF